MTISEMRELPSSELEAEVEKTREKVFKMRFQGKGKDMENPGEYKAMRKRIARLHTVLRERAVAARPERPASRTRARRAAARGGKGSRS